MSDVILTVAQAAEYLKVCYKTVRRLIEKQELVASKVGNSWRIQLRDIEYYLFKNCNCNK